MIALYFGGIFMGILMAFIFRETLFKGEAVPFVMELPNYRMPGAKNVGHLLWDKAKDFLQRAFTVIFMATLVIWFLQTFGTHLNVVEDSKAAFSPLSPAVSPRFLAAWIWRLESIDRPSNRIYGKGECRLHTFRTVRHDRAADRNSDTGFRIKPSGFLPPLYAVCGGSRFHQAGAWRQMGSRCCRFPVCDRLAGSFCRTWLCTAVWHVKKNIK